MNSFIHSFGRSHFGSTSLNIFSFSPDFTDWWWVMLWPLGVGPKLKYANVWLQFGKRVKHLWSAADYFLLPALLKIHLQILLIASSVISFRSAHIFTLIPPATCLRASYTLAFSAVQFQHDSVPIRFMKLYCKCISGHKAQPLDLQTSGNTGNIMWWKLEARFHLVSRQI